MKSPGLWMVLIALALAGCASPDPEEALAAIEPAEIAQERAEVALDSSLQREAEIMVEEVRTQALPEVIRATGSITINENTTWRVGSVAEGRIMALLVEQGDQVESGQVLARMFSHETHQARAEYRRAVSELQRLESALAYAQSVRDRTQRLYELKAASLQQVEQAQTELRNAEAALANGRVELQRTRVHLEQFLQVPAEPAAAPHVPGDAPEHDFVPIKSPGSGTLLQRNVTTGMVVQPSDELFVVTDLSTIWMIAHVSEERLPSLRIGMPAKVYVQAYPGRPFPGRLTDLGTELDPTTRTITARIDLPNSHGLLKPEMYATAELELDGTRSAIFVPEIAVQEVEGMPSVFVKTSPETFEARPVATAGGAGGRVEVLTGLRDGEQVVTNGSFLLKAQLLKATLAEE